MLVTVIVHKLLFNRQFMTIIIHIYKVFENKKFLNSIIVFIVCGFVMSDHPFLGFIAAFFAFMQMLCM